MKPVPPFSPFYGLIISLTILTIIFFPVFYSDYAYLDEAHQLWHNQDGTNFNLFFLEGRWLTGELFNRLWASIPSVSGLKFVRIFSFLSWVLFLEEYFRLGKKWQQLIDFDSHLLLLGGLYIACCPSLTIYIGWASCFVWGTANLLGLWCGHLIFVRLLKNGEPIRFPPGRILLIFLLGLGSLFLYQTGFATLLLPFIFYLVKNKSNASFRVLKFGIGGYLVLSAMYYLLFTYSLKHAAVQASDRMEISFDILGKLGFFFSAPLAQAFSFNFLYNMHSIPSQAFPIVLMVTWIVCYWRKDKNKPGKKLIFLLVFIGMCMLIYAPLMVAKENFASYRTMFMLNLTVTLVLLDTILALFREREKYRTLFFIGAALCFAGIGFRNFRYNFIYPLREEYQDIRAYFNKAYQSNVKTVYFLRPPENLFYSKYGVNPFKDEFGIPSTFRDWTPEPLIKQLILEKTGSRAMAEDTKVIQFTERSPFEAERSHGRPDELYVDVEYIFSKNL